MTAFQGRLFYLLYHPGKMHSKWDPVKIETRYHGLHWDMYLFVGLGPRS
jgi:hypothetical protein